MSNNQIFLSVFGFVALALVLLWAASRVAQRLRWFRSSESATTEEQHAVALTMPVERRRQRELIRLIQDPTLVEQQKAVRAAGIHTGVILHLYYWPTTESQSKRDLALEVYGFDRPILMVELDTIIQLHRERRLLWCGMVMSPTCIIEVPPEAVISYLRHVVRPSPAV